MTSQELLAATAILAAAGFAHGLFGIGFGMIATPLLALFLDYRLALFMSALPLLVMAASWLLAHLRARSQIAGQARLLPGIVLGAVAGSALQLGLPERVSVALLAGLLALNVALPWLLTHGVAISTGATRRAAPLFGLLAGITESALNVGAPFMLLYGALARLSRHEQLLVLNVCFALGKAIQVSLMALTWPRSATPTALLAASGVSLVGYWAGHRFAGRFPDTRFRRLLRNFLVGMVLALLIRAALAP